MEQLATFLPWPHSLSGSEGSQSTAASEPTAGSVWAEPFSSQVLVNRVRFWGTEAWVVSRRFALVRGAVFVSVGEV